MYLFSVAHIFNLPYRRFVIGRTLLAGRRWQVKNLRYSRLQVCATGAVSTINRYRHMVPTLHPNQEIAQAPIPKIPRSGTARIAAANANGVATIPLRTVAHEIGHNLVGPVFISGHWI